MITHAVALYWLVRSQRNSMRAAAAAPVVN
jgi:hypothetical protein